MNNLTTLPNIGKVLADKLEEIGISTPEDLKRTGAENAFIKLYTVDDSSCLCKLYALEGAIQEIRWHNLSAARKNELKEFFYHCQNR